MKNIKLVFCIAALSLFIGSTAWAKSKEKEIKISAKSLKDNKFGRPDGQFSYDYKAESENLVLFWDKSFGKNPATYADKFRRFYPDEILREGERFYTYYVDKLKFADKKKSLSSRYKMIIWMYNDDKTTAYGWGEDGVGMMWMRPCRAQSYPYCALAHEMGHSFQFMVGADGALGQYILIVPDKDMVVVITECTLIDGRRQRRLVWNRLLPEVGDQVLAPGKDYKRLQKKQRSYQLPLVQGKAASSLSQKYAGKRILLGENKYGWQSIELQFKQQEVVMTVVEKDGKTYSLPFGYKQWSKAAIDGYPPYSVAAKGRFKGIEGPFQVAGSYAWASLDALQLKVHYVNWISALGLTLCFEDNKVLLTVTENYSSGEGVTFEGTLAH